MSFSRQYLSFWGSITAASLLGIAVVLTAFTNDPQTTAILNSPSLTGIPLTIGEWRGVNSAPLDDRAKAILQLDNSLKRTYRNSKGDELFLYIGYWQSQSGDTQSAKHSPAMCLPANGWQTTKPKSISIELSQISSNKTLEVTEIVGSIRDQQWLYLYWFFSGDTTYAGEDEALLNTTIGFLSGARSDGGIVTISLPIGKIPNNEETLQEAITFVKLLYPDLQEIINQATPGLAN